MGFAMRPVDQGGLGLNRAQAAGLVGNLQQESFSDLRLNATGDQGTAHGIAQWRGDRWAGLQQYAAANGMNPNSHEAQQGFMRQELMGGYKGAYAALQAARTPEEAANAFRSKYEISNSGAAARIANANKLFGQGDQATTDDISRQSATGAAPSTQAPAGPGAAIGSAMRGAGQPGAGPPGGGGGGLGSILGMFGGGQQYSTMQQAQNIIKSMEIGGGGNIDTQLRPVVRDGQVYVVGTQGQNNVNIHVGPAASGVAPPGDSAGGAAIPTPTARPDNANAMGGPIPSPAPRPEGAGWGAGAQPVQNWQAPAPFQGATGNLNNTPGDRTFESLYNQRTGGAVFPPGGDVMQQRGQLSGEGGGKAPMAGESFSGRWQDRVGTPMQPSAPSMGAKAPVPYLSQDQLKGIDPQGSQMAPDQTPISSEQLSQLQSQDLGSMFDLGGMQMGQLADMSNYSPDMMDFGGGFGFG